MTVSKLYTTLKTMLEKAGCDSPAFDACCLLEDIAHLPHGRHFESMESAVDPILCDAVLTAAQRRANGEPLQYILGQWDFLSLTLDVGDGVLIPRPDTELLCEVAAQKLADVPHPCVLDLCAGSGCVGLGVCSLLPNTSSTEVELSDAAFAYLQRNIARYPQYNVCAVQDDVLAPQKTYSLVDAILSNPPYIPSDDIPGLMREVQHEPKMALDGSPDGLLFYREIVKQWLAYLKNGGWLIVELGIGQAGDVQAIFENVGLCDVAVYRDMGHIERVVAGRKPL